MQEAHEEALQAALNTFNLEAVGGGTSRKKYEKEFYITIKKQFEVLQFCNAYDMSVNVFLSISLPHSLRLYKFRIEECWQRYVFSHLV